MTELHLSLFVQFVEPVARPVNQIHLRTVGGKGIRHSRECQARSTSWVRLMAILAGPVAGARGSERAVREFPWVMKRCCWQAKAPAPRWLAVGQTLPPATRFNGETRYCAARSGRSAMAAVSTGSASRTFTCTKTSQLWGRPFRAPWRECDCTRTSSFRDWRKTRLRRRSPRWSSRPSAAC